MITTWIFGIVFVGGAVLFASLGVLIVRRRVATGQLKRHHEVAGYLLSIVGTLYSVLLGLIVVDTQTRYQEAKNTSQHEADSCLDMFHITYNLPLKIRADIHNELQEYLRHVVEEEWEKPTPDGSFNESAADSFRAIWWTLTDYQPVTAKEVSCFEKTLDFLQQLSDARRYRIQVARVGMPPVLWGVLIAGGVLTVLFTYLFEVEDAKAHLYMTGLVTLALALNVLLVALFSNPYKGYMRISSYAFQYDLRVMQELLKIRPDKGPARGI